METLEISTASYCVHFPSEPRHDRTTPSREGQHLIDTAVDGGGNQRVGGTVESKSSCPATSSTVITIAFSTSTSPYP